MIGVNKFYIMNYKVIMYKKYNQMVHIEIKMKNGQHIQLYMDGMYNQYGHNYQVVVI